MSVKKDISQKKVDQPKPLIKNVKTLNPQQKPVSDGDVEAKQKPVSDGDVEFAKR